MSSERLSILKQLNECGRTLSQNNIVCLGSGLPVIINTDLWFSVSCFSSLCPRFVRSLKPKESSYGWVFNWYISISIEILTYSMHLLPVKQGYLHLCFEKNGWWGIRVMTIWWYRKWCHETKDGNLNYGTLMVTCIFTNTRTGSDVYCSKLAV